MRLGSGPQRLHFQVRPRCTEVRHLE
jgi:hypothetical protein